MNDLLLDALVAAVPIVTILVLMLGRRWPATRAGGVGLSVALILAWAVFGFGQRVYGEIGIVGATGGALLEAAFQTATIVWIVFPALCLYHLQQRTGAFNVLRAVLGRLSDDPRILAILIAWFFALFIEGAAGFGTTIALAAPFLVSIGVRPVQAVAAVLISHVVGTSFGAVGTPIVPQQEATGLGALELARSAGLYHALLGWIMLAIAMAIAIRAIGGGSNRAIWGWIALAAALYLVPFFLLAWFLGPELPTLGGALLGGIGFVAVLALTQRRAPSTTTAQHGAVSSLDGARAASPYLALVVLVLITRLIPPVQQQTSHLTWTWTLFDRFSGSFQPLYQPGTLLLLALATGVWVTGARRADVRGAVGQTMRQLGPVVLALFAMLALSRTMVHAGMIDVLALAAADVAGPVWPLLTPFVGVLGSFVTGSATTSNILFTDFQLATAQNLALSATPLVGAQNFGAAAGNMVAPHNIIAGSATVGLQGQEGAILRYTLLACGVYALLGGVIALLISAG